MPKHDKPYPGKKSREFPNGRNWRHCESTPQTTAGVPKITMEPAWVPWGAGLELKWDRTDLSLTAGPDDAPVDHSGPSYLRLRQSRAEVQEIVSRIIVAMAEDGPPEAAEA
jgi:hypothetical protein